MQPAEDGTASDQRNPIDAARVAIWRLFQEGYVDEDCATAGLLAVDLGTRRAQRRTPTMKARQSTPDCEGTKAAVGRGARRV
jgi:hypothetical protein